MQRIWSITLYLHSFFAPVHILVQKAAVIPLKAVCWLAIRRGRRWRRMTHTCLLVALCLVDVRTVSFTWLPRKDFEEHQVFLRLLDLLEDPLLYPTTSVEKEKKKKTEQEIIWSISSSCTVSVKDEETKRCSESGGSFSNPASPFQFLEITTFTEARRARLESDRFDISCWVTAPEKLGCHPLQALTSKTAEAGHMVTQNKVWLQKNPALVNFVCLLLIFVLW